MTVPSSDRYLAEGISALPDLSALWAESTGSHRVCVAVLDSSVDLAHPCFDGAEIGQLETLAPMAVNSKAGQSHGTHVASVIFGQHDSPVRGIAPGCRGLIVPVFRSDEGELLSPCSQVDLARAISLAVQHGAHIINISGGQLDPSGEAHPLLANAVRLCAENHVLIVAAAGNDGCDCLHIPAAEPSVLVVGAMDSHGAPLEFSNWGERYRERGILAPGENILGAVPGRGTALRSGTSFATPIISGVVALMLSIQVERGEKPDPHAACNAILSSAIGCDQHSVPDCSRLLAGRLNLVGALTYLKKGVSMEMSELKPEVPDPNSNSEEERRRQVRSVEPKTIAAQHPTPGLQPARLDPAQQARVAAKVQSQASSDATSLAPGQITPSGTDGGCGCGGGNGKCSCNGESNKPQLVYALGEIGYDFVSQARHDSLLQHSGVNVDDQMALLDYLKEAPASASAVIWTLNIDSTPVYAIQPAGAFAATGYDLLRELLGAQLKEGAERVSVPGYIWGKVPLTCSVTVPIIVPEIRGMYSWTIGALVAAVAGKATAKKEESAAFQKKVAGIQNFFERVYYEIRNLGVAPQERALNYAATNAFQLEHIYRTAIERGLELDSIEVEKSPICRPESDCWDVKLIFFNPTDRLGQARRVHRFTVDVSDVVPVTVGRVREWAVY